jgi:retinol dehydrogenase-12
VNGKVCLVTGATSGIGEATARGLARLGARVFVHGRDGEKCARVVHAIKAATGNTQVESVLADFASLAAVRTMAEDLRTRLPRLDVLVNNAGTMAPGRRVTAEGLDRTFVVNHLAPFLLTNVLLDRLRASRPARIVNVASMMHGLARVTAADLDPGGPYGWMQGYNRSKLALVLFTRALARRLSGSGVVANAVHPGAVRSREPNNAWARLVARSVLRFMLSAEEGARTSLHLAASPDTAEVSGLYFVKCVPVAPSRYASDDDLAERLWRVSEKLTGLA